MRRFATKCRLSTRNNPIPHHHTPSHPSTLSRPTARRTNVNIALSQTNRCSSSSSLPPQPQRSNSLAFDPLVPFKVLNPISKKGTPNDQPIPDLGEMEHESFAVKAYSLMLGLPILDTMMNNLQRQGRVSFYMTSYGEEGAIVGSAAALGDHDEVFAQYREDDQSSSGRQMPIHYASKQHHFHSISSPLATQIPQAAGAAYALKRMRQKGERMNDCVICYMGEGAASEGDFHAGVNMASVLGGPIVFFIRNNGFAISTPSSEQFKGDGIASRAAGYGIDAIRVDGNDPLAVYLVTREARRRALEGAGRAVIVEAMTYRVGHHSTSDDSSAYRNPNEVDQWRKRDNPVNRMRNFLESKGWWDHSKEENDIKKWKSQVSQSVKKAEKVSKPPLKSMWTDVYGTPQAHLDQQGQESRRIIEKWSNYQPYKDELRKFKQEKPMKEP